MISEKEKKIILDCAKKYKVDSVILFGSSISKNKPYNDIDIAVKGLVVKYFFKFYAELFKQLPKPVDLIDLSNKSLFSKLIEENGIKIYG